MALRPLRVVRVSQKELQDMFAERGCEQRIDSGELKAKKQYDARPDQYSGFSPWDRSQVIKYYYHGNYVGMVHQVEQIDFSRGASGYPDPKEIRIRECLYILETED